MTIDNDKKAAEEWANNNYDIGYEYEKTAIIGFLAGCAHKEKQLESEREQVAREAYYHAWEVSREQLDPFSSQVSKEIGYETYKAQVEFSRQQKQKERIG